MKGITVAELDARQLKLAIVASRFNGDITDTMLIGAMGAIEEMRGQPRDVEVVRVPGAYELPIVAKALAETKKYDGVLCLGSVIRGDTPHFDFISSAAAQGLMQAQLDTGVPITFGVLTTETVEQAWERADLNRQNKGAETVRALVETVTTLKSFKNGKSS